MPSRPALAAPVSGFAAFVMARVLDDALPARIVGLQRQAESGRLHPDLLAELAISDERSRGLVTAQVTQRRSGGIV